MRLYFVIDVKRGIAVRAYRGERERYGSIRNFSRVVRDDDPLKVLSSIRPRFAYIADLDGIEGRGRNLELAEKAAGIVDELLFDGGFRCPDDVVSRGFIPVLGTETFRIEMLDEVKCDYYVSLDLHGEELAGVSRGLEVRRVVEILNSYKPRGVIVIQMDRVGSMSVDLRILEVVLDISQHPVLYGGGVGGLDDLLRLKDIGCSGVLVSTSVHRGLIDVELLRRGRV